ncbi:hypothetical protein IQ255_18190 [Pleurocapsales cyanobacterium LEGE 10410]|nr:hypothetical protein [Pleurocapsales cyanobacterium LEGE 10410]
MNRAKYNLLSVLLLSLGAFWVTWNIAIADTGLIPAPNIQDEQPTEILSAETLPPAVQSAVFDEAMKRTSKTVADLKIVSARSQTWSDGCLNLAQPNELCSQVITPGWRVVVTDGIANWTYRTDDSGALIRLEESSP